MQDLRNLDLSDKVSMVAEHAGLLHRSKGEMLERKFGWTTQKMEAKLMKQGAEAVSFPF
jgi:hypothetical protein